jgi:hypothetical protein
MTFPSRDENTVTWLSNVRVATKKAAERFDLRASRPTRALGPPLEAFHPRPNIALRPNLQRQPTDGVLCGAGRGLSTRLPLLFHPFHQLTARVAFGVPSTRSDRSTDLTIFSDK